MTPDSEKLQKLIEKVKGITKDNQLLSRVNLPFDELNQFNEQIHVLAILISQDLEFLLRRN